jgi:hypothetical protein
VLQPFGRVKPDQGPEIFFRYSQIKSHVAPSKTEAPVSVGDTLDFCVARDEIGPFAVDIDIVERKKVGQQRFSFGRSSFGINLPSTNITAINGAVGFPFTVRLSLPPSPLPLFLRSLIFPVSHARSLDSLLCFDLLSIRVVVY